MENNKTEKKDIAEIKDNGEKASADKKKVLELSKVYEFEGEKISSLDFSGLEKLTTENMIRANNIMENAGMVSTVPENTMYYALIIASDATGMPIEFLKKLNIKDAFRMRRMVTRFFLTED
jgi:hypothetical protein